MKLHAYVLSLVGVLFLFAISFPVAFLRVAQTPKFTGTYLKSLTLEGTVAEVPSRRIAELDEASENMRKR